MKVGIEPKGHANQKHLGHFVLLYSVKSIPAKQHSRQEQEDKNIRVE